MISANLLAVVALLTPVIVAMVVAWGAHRTATAASQRAEANRDYVDAKFTAILRELNQLRTDMWALWKKQE